MMPDLLKETIQTYHHINHYTYSISRFPLMVGLSNGKKETIQVLNPIIVQVLQQFRPQSMPGVRASLSPSKAWKMAGGIRAWKTYGKFGFQFLAYQPWNRISPKCEVQNTLDMDVSAVHWIWMYLQMGASNTLKYQIVAVAWKHDD